MVRNTKPSSERPSKRARRLDMQKDYSALKDLANNESLENEIQDEPSTSARPLWGEVEPDTPRWSSSRRRSNLRPPPPLIPPISDQQWQGCPPPVDPHLPDHRHPHPSHNLPMHSRIPTPQWLPPVQLMRPPPALPEALPRPPGTINTLFEAERNMFDDDDVLPPLQTASAFSNVSVLDPLDPTSRPPHGHPEHMRDLADDFIQARLDQYEQMEALDALTRQNALENPLAFPRAPPPPPTLGRWRTESSLSNRENPPRLRVPNSASQPPAPPPRPRQHGTGSTQMMADIMMELLTNETLPISMRDNSRIIEQISAFHEAISGQRGSGPRLPAHLLFSDRDFNENDYDALLALDDTIPSRQGASQEQIDAIPTSVIGAQNPQGTETRCPICLEDFEAGATLRVMHCKHAFHLACLDTWLAKKGLCPICQRSCK